MYPVLTFSFVSVALLSSTVESVNISWKTMLSRLSLNIVVQGYILQLRHE